MNPRATPSREATPAAPGKAPKAARAAGGGPARACGAPKAKGGPCCVPALGGSDPPRCFVHSDDPAIVTKREEARRQGGEQRARQMGRAASVAAAPSGPAPLALRTHADAAAVLARVVAEVYAGSLDARSANAITAATQAALGADLLDPAPTFATGLSGFMVKRSEEGLIGLTEDGRQVALTDGQAERVGKWMVKTKAELGIKIVRRPPADEGTGPAPEAKGGA